MELQRYLRCLGQPALFAPTGEPIRFRTRKHLALLVYIAVDARSHRRDRLAELLWPKVSESEARHSLATALSTLRPRLGLDALETSRDHVRLLPGRVALDLDRLQAGDVLGTEVTGPLEVAAFLDGFDITDSAEFTHWKDRQQARLLPVIKDALLVLIDRCRRTGNSRRIEEVADRMLALDELSEEAIRAKMEARAFAGDRLTALEIFEAWKKKLADELQAMPSDLVEGMAVRLRRRGWERTTLANIPNVPTDQWRGRPFIGRTAEYQVLYERWEAARKGLPGHVMVLGDSGVGKTTLVQRLTTAAGLEGAAISRVQCYDLEREIPYSTLTTLVRGLLDRPGVSATSPEALAELSQTIPEVRHRFPHLAVATETQGETARIRLTEASLEMLSAIAEEQPVIIVIDDLHLADDVSLAVLHLILRRCKEQPIMAVLVARPGELAQSSSQALCLRDSAPQLGIHEIELRPLSSDESQNMLDSLMDPDEPQPTVVEQQALLRAAAGYPMVLELLVQDWKASGEQSLALGLDAMTTDLRSAGSAHLEYRHILDRITRSIDSTTHNVLNLAAILGPRLNDLGMFALVDLTAGQTMTALTELVVRRVLRDAAQGLEFTNELIRAAAYVAVPATMRRLLHGRIADCFIQQHVAGREDLGLSIAWHCIRAGRISEATQYLLSGARDSIRKGALHAAERALSTAIPHLSDPERGEATLLLVEVMQEQGRWGDSLAVLHNGGAFLEEEAVLVLSIPAQYFLYGTTQEEIHSQIDRLQRVIRGNYDSHIRLRAARVAASLNSNLRDPHLAKLLLRSLDTIPMPTEVDDLARLFDCRAQLLYYAFDRASAVSQLAHLTEKLSDERLVNSTVASLHTGLGVLACSRGEYVEAKAAFLRAYDVNVRLGNDSAVGVTAAQVALSCLRLGEYQAGIEWAAHATLICYRVPFAGYLEIQAAGYLGLCQALLGNSREALQTIEGLECRMPKPAPPWSKQIWCLYKADILLYLGLVNEALEAGRDAVGSGRYVLYDRGFAGGFARWVALTARGTSREREGAAEIRRLTDEVVQFDALDQVEVLCANLAMLSSRGMPPEDLKAGIKARLKKLPSAVADQLYRWGMLSITDSPSSIGVFA